MVVIEPGMFTSVQDLGRRGYSASGVAAGGAADWMSLRACNRLVGNDDGAAGLEMTLVGGIFRFESIARVVISGGAKAAQVTGADGLARPAVCWQPIQLRPGDQLRTGPMTGCARAYVGVEGGLAVPRVLGSCSTHLAGGFGGFCGRALRAGDRLELGSEQGTMRDGSLAPETAAMLSDPPGARVLAAVDGAHAELFSAEAAEIFWNSTFTVSMQSDRVGVRLEGKSIAAPSGGRLVSQGMPPGAVQVPENGKPIVLGPDHPTTGGYPVIACIATADTCVLGRAHPGDTLRFQRVSMEEARELYRERERQFNAGFGAT